MATAEERPSNPGYCVICENDTVFVENHSWLRDHYLCERCKSIPRNRALVHALNVFCPEWKGLTLHESSPAGPLSAYLQANGKNYSASHYYSDVPRGEYKDGIRSEDLSRLTFDSESFDLFITSDVFEHVIEPEAAFSEIARVLRPGGMHVFTMPFYPALDTSVQRAKLDGGEIAMLEEPIYHGNPLTADGSLVTYDWGRDFPLVVYQASSLSTAVLLVRDRNLGLDGEFLEVFMSRKAETRSRERLKRPTLARRWRRQEETE